MATATDALVVVESMWGHTRAVAEAVARGLRSAGPVLDVGDAPVQLPDGTVLLVVGGPTHAFSMSRRSTRHEAAARGAPEVREATGIREWLDGLVPTAGLRVATFDTRVDRVRRLPGSAARSAGRRVRHRGLGRVMSTESFYVADVGGPLLPGELARATTWGARLAMQVAGPETP
ncbi:flavodoxin family protein [Nocardioides aurantiacus]|uniref:Flavodoxin n=1 Tax=Nocardioides aurantiacus TaxID=86796 RepID=A0A3N2CTL9_9ACTN|nr:flavodoxin family protein [Nocardioides aurantiacus]ROR90861.1 hypothetical protein EDD33_1710 [Nocardioides aurantiacus]